MQEHRSNSERSQQATAPLCQNNCGFYANKQCKGYCSQCFKKIVNGSGLVPVKASLDLSSSGRMSPLQLSQDALPTPTPTKTSLERYLQPIATSANLNTFPPDSPREMKVQSSRFKVERDSCTFHDGNFNNIQLGAESQEQQDLVVSKVEEMNKVQKNKSKCWSCKKKIGIQGVQCRCGYVFCYSHRQPEDHECSFDFRHFDRQQLASNNPQIIASKISKV
eukprot:TRINITY_DN2229_c0_g1_i1.p1 TRINITY_DN2229_c0_g1~~TRINITY_DN2229_c0_g1_i1.p1  ORF type:complete len:221 (-),score=14.15 TRINITY_DN2229_c0_g1_i1:575-1237(-)